MDTHQTLSVIGLLVASAITPGPNNFIVMEAGARGGLSSAGRVTAGVLLGSLFLLACVLAGMDAALSRFARLPVVLAVLGGSYLAWLGVSMILRSHRPVDQAHRAGRLPTSILGVAAFQVANPKAWLLVTTAAATVSSVSGAIQLAVSLVIVSAGCLSVWAAAGASASRWLARPRFRAGFDRAMGVLLSVSAVGLVVDTLA
jgi:threonine/homoserine/homoserine lactone efflux protein